MALRSGTASRWVMVMFSVTALRSAMVTFSAIQPLALCPLSSTATTPRTWRRNTEITWWFSLPFEDFQRDDKTHETPRDEYRDRKPVGRKRRAFVHQCAQHVVQRRERQRLDERLQHLRKALRREERARQQPHRQHDEVHQT